MEFYWTSLFRSGSTAYKAAVPFNASLFDYFAASRKLKQDLVGRSSVVKSTYGERPRSEFAFRYTVVGEWPDNLIPTYELATEVPYNDTTSYDCYVLPVSLFSEIPKDLWGAFPYWYAFRTGNKYNPIYCAYPIGNGTRPTYFKTALINFFSTSTWRPKNINPAIFNDKSAYLQHLSMEPVFPTVELSFPQLRTVAEILCERQDYLIAVRKQNSKVNAEIAQRAKALSINSIAFLSDLLSLRETVSQITSLLTRLSHVSTQPISKTVGIIADGQLIDSYVVRTTMSDLAALQAAFDRVRAFYSASVDKRIYTARYTDVDTIDDLWGGWSANITLTEKVRYDSWDQSVLPLMRMLQSVDFFPSFTNVWDLIPMSFVLDWIYPFNELFKELDTDTYVSTLPIREVFYSRHTRFYRADWPSDSRLKDITLSVYRRGCLPRLLEGAPYLPEAESISLTHIPEAFALLIQQSSRLT